MSTKSLVVAAIGVATVVAAGAGSFMASRTRSAVPAPEAKTAAALQAPVPPAVIGTSVPVEQPAPPAAPAPAPPARVETPAVQARPKVDHGSPAAQSSTPARRPSPAPAEPAASPSPSPAATAPAASPVTPATPDVFTPLPTPASVPPPAPPPPPDPPKPKFEEVTVREDAVIGIRLDGAVNSETAKVEDRVSARVSRDVNVDGRTAIPAGATLEGTVTLVERGGKFKERARLGIRFTTLVLADNTRLPIQTETIFRDGDSPTSEATSKIGASAVVGAILGAVIGGKKGAVIGGATGAAGGTAAVQAGGRNEASIPAGSPLTVRLTSPLAVMVERQQDSPIR